ncbi:MAG: hypothetical protein IJS32_02565 [Kiritimatiellae bacterium]|nr:hypothetical protein [Kiritimatiellia bacterium]
MKTLLAFLAGVAAGIWFTLDSLFWGIVAPRHLHDPDEGVCIGPLPEDYDWRAK